jgi:hypothetical protein
MGFFSSIFGANPAVAAGEGAAAGVVGIAKGVSDIVEKLAPTDGDKVKMQIDVQDSIAKAVNEARQYDPRTVSTTAFGDIVNVLVDAFSRLIRPTVTVLMVGGVFGWFDVQTKSLDPTVLSWGGLCIGYWFGVRTITQDIPTLLKAVKGFRS